MEELKIEEVARHRNGVGGEGFYVVSFGHGRLRMVGVVFEPDEDESAYDPRCAVFDRDLLGQGVIAFGTNSFRGDHFYPALHAAIEAWEHRRNQELGLEPELD